MSLAPDSAQGLVCPSPVDVSPFSCCLSAKICRQIAPEGGGWKLPNMCAWKTENSFCVLLTLSLQAKLLGSTRQEWEQSRTRKYKMYSCVISCLCQHWRTHQCCFELLARLFTSWIPWVCLLNPMFMEAYVPMLGNTWVRLMCKIEYLGNGGSLESSVWVQSVNSWCIWLLIHKLFLKCCFTLHFLWCLSFQYSWELPTGYILPWSWWGELLG